MKKLHLIILLLILISSICVVVVFNLRTTKVPGVNLEKLVKESFPAWKIEAIPIAQTPEMAEAVVKILNFDDAVTVKMEKDGKEVLLYAAFWQPRKVHPLQISVHYPEICWVENGWRRQGEIHLEVNKDKRNVLDNPARALVFEAHADQLGVAYWHFYDGKSYITNAWNDQSAGFWMRLKIKASILIESLMHGGKHPQLFLRVSAPVDYFEEEITSQSFEDGLAHMQEIAVK